MKKVIDFTKKNGPNDLKLAFLQFIIHRLNCEFVLLPEKLENWENEDILAEFTAEIHDSVSYESFPRLSVKF